MLGCSPCYGYAVQCLVARFSVLPTSGLGQLKAIPLGRRLLRIFDRLVDQARREPDDGMFSALVRAQDEDGERLSDAEIVSMVFLLPFAGHDRTSGLISTGMLPLLEHPDRREMPRSQPDIAQIGREHVRTPVTNAPLVCRL